MDEDNRNTGAAPGREKKERLTHREKRRRWKAAKRAKRQELKDYYQYAPWLKRVWNLYLKGFFRGLVHLLVLLAVIGMLVVSAPAILAGVMGPVIREYYDRVKNQPRGMRRSKRCLPSARTRPGPSASTSSGRIWRTTERTTSPM